MQGGPIHRLSLALAAAASLVLPSTPVLALGDGPTIVSNGEFCDLVADDAAACERTLETFGSAGMLPEAFAALIVPGPTYLAATADGDTAEGAEVLLGESENAVLGTSLSRNDVRVSVEQVDWKPKPENRLFRPGKGNKFVSVLIRYEALEENASYDRFYWTACDKDGFAYDHSLLDAKEPRLLSGQLREGRVTQGWITFEVPKNVNWLEVQESRPSTGDFHWTVER
jgi:hypothetical protein